MFAKSALALILVFKLCTAMKSITKKEIQFYPLLMLFCVLNFKNNLAIEKKKRNHIVMGMNKFYVICSESFAETLGKAGAQADLFLYEGKTHTDLFLQVSWPQGSVAASDVALWLFSRLIFEYLFFFLYFMILLQDWFSMTVSTYIHTCNLYMYLIKKHNFSLIFKVRNEHFLPTLSTVFVLSKKITK